MIKFGQVKEYNEAKHMAKVEFTRPEACAKCGGCGTMSQKGSISLKADACKEGDWVRVELPEGRFLQATAMAYVVPLIGLLGGLALGYVLSAHNELIAIAGALLGVLLALGALWLNEKRIAGKPEWTPHITEVFEQKPSIDDIGCHGSAED